MEEIPVKETGMGPREGGKEPWDYDASLSPLKKKGIEVVQVRKVPVYSAVPKKSWASQWEVLSLSFWSEGPHISQGRAWISPPLCCHWLWEAWGECGFSRNMVLDPEGQQLGHSVMLLQQETWGFIFMATTLPCAADLFCAQAQGQLLHGHWRGPLTERG